MSNISSPAAASRQIEIVEVHLRDPGVAALLAWLWPGAGHLYQRRYAKGILFMVCIVGTFFFGLTLGGGKVVYASWEGEMRRWHFLGQAGVGLPSMLAVVQHARVAQGLQPFFGGLMAPPPGRTTSHRQQALTEWHKVYGWKFEMGTLFTLVAGLLNVLAIYDAFAGPVLPPSEEEKNDKPPPKKKKKGN